VAEIAFGASGLEADMFRGDLFALLHSIRLVSLCRLRGVGHPATVAHALDTLRTALSTRFDATGTVPGLRDLATKVKAERGKMLTRRLASDSCAQTRAAAASTAIEVLNAAAAFTSPAAIARLAEGCGLQAGDDEGEVFDAAAARARAQGDLFFEDVGGLETFSAPGTKRKAAKEGVKPENFQAAVAAIHRKGLEDIAGVEDMRPDEGELAKGVSGSESEGEEGQAAEKPAKRARRSRQKGVAAAAAAAAAAEPESLSDGAAEMLADELLKENAKAEEKETPQKRRVRLRRKSSATLGEA